MIASNREVPQSMHPHPQETRCVHYPIIPWALLCMVFKHSMTDACTILKVPMLQLRLAMKAYKLIQWPNTLLLLCYSTAARRNRMILEGKINKFGADECRLAQIKMYLPPVFNPLSLYWVDVGRSKDESYLHYSMKIVDTPGELRSTTATVWIYSKYRIRSDLWPCEPSLDSESSGCFYVFLYKPTGVFYVDSKTIGFENRCF